MPNFNARLINNSNCDKIARTINDNPFSSQGINLTDALDTL